MTQLYTHTWVQTDGGRSRYFAKKNTGDCVCRAIAIGTSTNYLTVWQALCDIARETGNLPNEPDCYTQYLEEQGWQYVKLPKPFKPLIEHRFNDSKKRIMYVRAGYGTHLVVYVEGKTWDTWCPNHCYAYGYWVKKEAL